MLIGDEETHTHSRHTERKAKQRGALESQNSRALLENGGSKVSAEASSANLGLVSVKKASVVQWPRTVCDLLSPSITRGPAGGRQKRPRFLSRQAFVSSQEGEKEVNCKFISFIVAPLPVCLPTSVSV